MSVRFEPAARQAIHAAMEDAERRGHFALSPAHLLLALVRAPAATAVRALEKADVALDALRSALEQVATSADDHPGAHDGRARDETETILARAAAIADGAGLSTVSDVAILIAAAESQTTVGERLRAAGASADKLREMLDVERSAARPSGQAAVVRSGLARTGIGYDSHRIVAGGPMRLGGVSIPGELSLSGHSDGDAVAHALTDAVLGAAGMGDIGELFPDSDPVNKGRDSIEMLAIAVAQVAREGFEVQQADVVVIAEQPRIGPHRAAMRARLASVLGVDAKDVSIKGKSNEGMGWIGRGEGLACMAVVTLTRTPR